MTTRRFKIIAATLAMLTPAAVLGAPAVIEGFASFLGGRAAPITPTGSEVLPLVQNGATTAMPLSGLAAYVVKGITPAGIGAQPALSFTPLNAAGGTMSGNLFAPVLGTGATTARTLSDRVADLYSVLDFGAKCDGSTNDTTAIQASLNAAATLSAQLLLVPRGKTCLVTNLQVPSYTHARIDGGLVSVDGHATLISNASPSTSHVVLEGDGYLNNKWPVSVPESQVLPAGVSCIQTSGPIQYWTIKGLTLQDCGYWPSNIVGGTSTPGAGAAHIYLNHVTAIGGNRASWEFAEGCDDCWAEDIHYETTAASDIGFTFYSNIRDSGIKHSYIKGSALGIAVLSDGTANQDLTSYPSTNILIEGNEILNSRAEAIEVHNAAGSYQSNIRIIGNDGHNNNYSLQANKGGETINECDGCTSIGNIWHEDGSGTSTSTPIAGINVYAAAKNFTSIGDTVKNEGAGGGIGIGVSLTDTSKTVYPSIQGLSVEDNQATPTMIYAIQGTCYIDCTLIGTKVIGIANAWAGFTPDLGSAVIFGNTGLTNVSQTGLFNNGNITLNAGNIIGNNATSAYSISSDGNANAASIQLNGSSSTNAGLLNFVAKSLAVNGAAAVSCSGPPSSSYVVTNGIVTHC